MNPIDSYRDPALDGLVGIQYMQSTGNKRSNRHSRQPSTAQHNPYPIDAQDQAQDASRGPTIAYPGADLSGQGLQRSFLQRARGRPYADEAFADDDLADAARGRLEHAQRQLREVTQDEPRPAVAATAPSDDLPIQNVPRAEPTVDDGLRRQKIQDNIRSAAKQAESGTYEDVEDHTGFSRAPTLKTAGLPADSRDWAPDRSPLQKLEVTLGSISKEEKRARMQEAELLHREKTHRQPERITSNRQSQKPTIEDVGVVRGLSNAHKERLHHSTGIESTKPDVARLTSDTPGFNYQSSALPRSSVTISRRKRGSGTDQIQGQPQRAVSSGQAQPAQRAVGDIAPNRSVSAAQPVERVSQAEPLASHPSQKYKSRQIYDSDRTPTSQERNASHRAALDQLTGKGRKEELRSSGQRNVSDPVSQPSRSIHRDVTTGTFPENNNLRNVQQQEYFAPRTSTPQGQSIPAGLGLQDSPGMRSVDSAAPTDNAANPVMRNKRRSSVSFKDPYDRRRPVDEWKAAETARLEADDFLLEPRQNTGANKTWWEDDPRSRKRTTRNMASESTIDNRNAEFRPKLFLKCGPLLRYTGIKRTVGEGAKEYWRGTVMIATQDRQSSYEKPPTLRVFSQPKSLYTRLKHQQYSENGNEHDDHAEHDPLAGSIKMSRIGRALYVKPAHTLPPNRDLSEVETDDGLFDTSPPMTNADNQAVAVTGISSMLSENNGEMNGRYKEIRGVRLYADPDRDITFWLFKLEIQLGHEQQHIGYRINGGAASGFWVPAAGHTMNIMFHSCNGFSQTVNPNDFSGPDPLWRDVLIAHQSRPFHVMIGGGDQIYNDRVMRDTQHFAEWTMNRNPHYKHHAPFTNEMKEELETFYLNNYCRWFSQGLFGMAGSQIPMVNMWDDHDIIDGFGSYPHPFMLSPVFSGVGNVAYKYYMLFQQHSVEAMTTADEPSWVLGYKPGPYIKQLSRSIFLDFGQSIALLALDCRTERMKNQVISLHTLDIALDRCRKEIIEGTTKHLIVLLGVPIAYPRMNWLENVLTSRAMEPVKALGRYGVVKGGFLNKFDGGVEVLDDLDDHWTAHHHKEERNEFIKELQDLAAERSVRITILGGDVHLAAIGQFYSNPKLKIPKDRDHRYMPNVVSSAIVNTPPPEMLADVLNKRDKVHHLDSYTQESMIPMFTHDVDGKKRNNKRLLPRRNWCSIVEYNPGKTPDTSRSSSPARSESMMAEDQEGMPQPKRRFSLSRDDLNPRMLFRRLSSRNAPPTAYREGGYPDEQGQRAASFDEPRSGRNGPTSFAERLGMGRRTASETRDGPTSETYGSDAEFKRRDPPPFRPGFHRRPTNLSEKAVKKGNVPAVDADGNEFDVNDHVNLDGGLDIVLNCEIDRQDPRGATEPYRLLVPALWYDGSSDREKLEGGEGLQRKPTLMNKFGFGGARNNKAAQGQGSGNWGQESDSESYVSNNENYDQKPKKKFGIFGSLKKKRPDYDEGDREYGQHYGAATDFVPGEHDHHDNSAVAQVHQPRDPNAVPSTTTPKDTPPKMGYQAGPVNYDLPQDSRRGPETTRAQNAPPADYSPASTPQRTSSGKGNVLRKRSQRAQASPAATFQPTSRDSQQNTYEPPHLATNVGTQRQSKNSYDQPQASPIQSMPPNAERRPSYTIGSNRSSGSRQDADSAYISGQQGSRAVSKPTGPPTSYRGDPANDPYRGSSVRSTSSEAPRRTLSKQEQILGIGTDHDAFSGNPQQRSLRGNGILGKDVEQYDEPQERRGGGGIFSKFGLGRSVSSSRRQEEPQQEQHEGEFAPQRTTSQGYREARPTRKRGLSLRDRARNLVDRFDGRRQYDDDDYYSDEDSHSDDLGEQEQAGHSQPQEHRGGQNAPREHGLNQHMRNVGEKQDQRHLNVPQQEYPEEVPYSDEGSFMSDEPEPPRRGFSQKLKGMFGGRQRREEYEEDLGDAPEYAAGGNGRGTGRGGGKYY